jgi:hypothetical protein
MSQGRISKKLLLITSVSICALFFSSIALYLAWTDPDRNQHLTKANWYTVTVISGAENYRVYILCNRQTITADESIGINIYPFIAEPGDQIFIRAYSNDSFSLEFAQEGPYQLIEQKEGTIINLTFTVPD